MSLLFFKFIYLGLELNKVYRIFNPTANSPIVIDRTKERNIFINSDLKRKDSENEYYNLVSLRNNTVSDNKNNTVSDNKSKASKSSSKSNLSPKSIQSFHSKLSQKNENNESSNNNQINHLKIIKDDIDLKNSSNNKFKLSTIMKEKDEQLQKKLSDIFIRNDFNNPIKRNNYTLSKENPFSASNRESLQFSIRKNIKNENNDIKRLAGS